MVAAEVWKAPQGTPGVSPPELHQYKLAGNKAELGPLDDKGGDMWALGVTGFGLITCVLQQWPLMFEISGTVANQMQAATPRDQARLLRNGILERQRQWVS